MMDSSSQQCRVRQCLTCKNNTVFYCFTCKRDLCNSCRNKHLHDLTTTFHDTVVCNAEKEKEINSLFSDIPHLHEYWRHMLQHSAYNSTICTIRSEDIFKRRAIMLEIQSDIKTFSTNMSSYRIPSKCVTKAQTLCKLINIFAGCDIDKISLILQRKKLTMKNHIARYRDMNIDMKSQQLNQQSLFHLLTLGCPKLM